MRGRRIMAGFRRIGIVLALILSLPLFVGVWFWITLGATPPRYVYFYLAGGVGGLSPGVVDRMDPGRLRRRG